jgi:pectin methylesterase-like acyl-CoA thioesterase
MEMHLASPVRARPGMHLTADRPVEEHATVLEQRDLDDRIAALIATNPGIGAVLIDAEGHVKLFASNTGASDTGFTLVPGVYSSIQAAIDAASDGDAIYIAAGTYREQLTIRGKQLDVLGAVGDDRSSLVTLESPDVANLDVDPMDADGELIAQCAVIRVRNDAHVTMRHLIIDGRHQGWVLRRSDPHLDFASISTVNADTVVEHVETRGFDLSEAVRLLDDCGHLKGTHTTIQAAINAAAAGDEVVIATGLYGEDLYIRERNSRVEGNAAGSGRWPGLPAPVPLRLCPSV